MDGFEATRQILQYQSIYELQIDNINDFHFDSERQVDSRSLSDQQQQVEKVPVSVVAVTSYTNKNYHQECMKVGMKEVLNKPVDADKLGDAIEEYMPHRLA